MKRERAERLAVIDLRCLKGNFTDRQRYCEDQSRFISFTLSPAGRLISVLLKRQSPAPTSTSAIFTRLQL